MLLRPLLSAVASLFLCPQITVAEQASTLPASAQLASATDSQAQPLAIPRAGTAAQPNILIILADDLGWKDVGYNGSEIRTPNLDRLANNGVQLNAFYSQPTCSPTRATLMTGQTPLRHGILRPLGKTATGSLPLDLTLLPEHMSRGGYQALMVGKWHLGHRERAMLPMARGFEHVYGNFTGGVGYYDHVHGGGLDWHRNGQALREAGYTTHLLATEAESLIRNRDQARPLFLYAAFNAPHLPNEAPEQTIAAYAEIENPHRRIHAAMVDELDQAIGRIINVLESEGMLDNTLIWFMSDNGGLNLAAMSDGFRDLSDAAVSLFGRPVPLDFVEFIRSNVEEGGSDNGPYRMGKGQLYQGGILVPSLVYWPATLAPRQVDQPVTVQDVLPTLAQAANVTLPATHLLDGVSQLALLETGAGPVAPPFYAVTASGLAVVEAGWKYLEGADGDELYHLDEDPFEETNLVSVYPKRLAQLQSRLNAIPRAEPIHLPLWRVIPDPDKFGGAEDRPPWADVVEN